MTTPVREPVVTEDVDIRELLESLDEPGCEHGHDLPERSIPGDPCPENADWILIASCGHTTYLCTPHAAATKRRIEGRGLCCARHGMRDVTVRWELLS